MARLDDVDGIVARWLHDGEYDENTAVAEGGTPQAIVVPGADTLQQHQSNVTNRTLAGHVIVEANVGVPMSEEKRAEVDEIFCQVEAVLLGISADTPTLDVPSVTQFDVTEVVTTFDGGGDGRWGARFDWSCEYRVSATDPREPS